MKNLLNTARTKDGNAIRRKMAQHRRADRAAMARINFADPYQIALMAYHAGWDLDGWGPRTARYPVNILATAARA